MPQVWIRQGGHESQLAPFPEKHFKWATDHLDVHFVRERRALLENFLRSLLRNRVFSSSAMLMSFVTPAEDDWSAKVDHQPERPEQVAQENSSFKLQVERAGCSALKRAPAERRNGVYLTAPCPCRAYAQLDDGDTDPPEFTGVWISGTQILREDHVVFQVQPRGWSTERRVHAHGAGSQICVANEERREDEFGSWVRAACFMPRSVVVSQSSVSRARIRHEVLQPCRSFSSASTTSLRWTRICASG